MAAFRRAYDGTFGGSAPTTPDEGYAPTAPEHSISGHIRRMAGGRGGAGAPPKRTRVSSFSHGEDLSETLGSTSAHSRDDDDEASEIDSDFVAEEGSGSADSSVHYSVVRSPDESAAHASAPRSDVILSSNASISDASARRVGGSSVRGLGSSSSGSFGDRAAGGLGGRAPGGAPRVNALVHRNSGGSGDAAAAAGAGDDDDVAPSSVCPLCWEEQPYLDDSRKSTAMMERVKDFRRIIFRFERMMRGLQNDETIFRGMLELRRQNIEQYLDAYSNKRFRRWTMAMLREHYDPINGHRHDSIREYDYEATQLKRVRKWLMDHAMFVTHPETGQQVFNMRAVDVRTRLSRQILDVMARKNTEMTKREETAQSDANLIMQAVNDLVNATTAASSSPNNNHDRGIQEGTAHDGRRRGSAVSGAAAARGSGVAQMYDIGGL